MWMPAGFIYIGLAAAIFALWLKESEAHDRKMERWMQHAQPDGDSERRRIVQQHALDTPAQDATAFS